MRAREQGCSSGVQHSVKTQGVVSQARSSFFFIHSGNTFSFLFLSHSRSFVFFVIFLAKTLFFHWRHVFFINSNNIWQKRRGCKLYSFHFFCAFSQLEMKWAKKKKHEMKTIQNQHPLGLKTSEGCLRVSHEKKNRHVAKKKVRRNSFLLG